MSGGNTTGANGATDPTGQTTGGALGDGANANAQLPEWANDLPEPVRQWDEVKNADSPDKFWDQVANMRSRLGRSITIPGEDASDEDKAAFRDKLRKQVDGLVELPSDDDDEGWRNVWQQLGAPEEPTGYKLPEVDDPLMTDERAQQLAAIAHKAGMTRRQLEAWMSDLMTAEAEAVEQQQAQREEAMGELRKEWGLAYKERLALAEKMRAEFFPHAEPDSLAPDDLKALAALGERFGKEGGEFRDQSGSGATMTPQDALVQISEIRNNPKHPYNNPQDPGYQAARDKMRRLYKMAYPDDNSSQVGVGVQGFGIG